MRFKICQRQWFGKKKTARDIFHPHFQTHALISLTPFRAVSAPHPSSFVSLLRCMTPNIRPLTVGAHECCHIQGTHREREMQGRIEHKHWAYVLSSLPKAFSCFCRQSRPPLIKTNERRASADNDRSAWISEHREKTAGRSIDGTRIASRTRDPVPRCLPPTSSGSDEETVSCYLRVCLTHTAALQDGSLQSYMVSKASQELLAPLCVAPEAQSR